MHLDVKAVEPVRGVLRAVAISISVALGAAYGAQARAQQVITIDQAKAMAGGITEDDAPGFPITLSKPGTYRLTGNLTVSAPNQHAFVVTAHNVTLDLGGFLVQGPVSCTGLGASYACQPGEGIGVNGASRMFTTVRNGTINGFFMGVNLGAHTRVEDLQVVMSSYVGIRTGENSLVARNLVSGGHYGIRSMGLIRDNVVHNARLVGIVAPSASLVAGNAVTHAGDLGIIANGTQGESGVVHNVLKNVGNVPITGTSLGDGRSNLCNATKC